MRALTISNGQGDVSQVFQCFFFSIFNIYFCIFNLIIVWHKKLLEQIKIIMLYLKICGLALCVSGNSPGMGSKKNNCLAID